jgi:hypothetical protein
MANVTGDQPLIALRAVPQMRLTLHNQELEVVAQSVRNQNSVGTPDLITAAHRNRAPDGKIVSFTKTLASDLPTVMASAGVDALRTASGFQ